MTPPDWQSAIEIHPTGWVCPSEPFWVAGWVASPALVPVDVRAWLGPMPFLGLSGLPRPDKEIATRGRAGPPQAGFSFLLKPVPGANNLRIEVRDQHGRWTEIFRQPVTSAGTPLPAPPAPSGPEPLLDLLRAHQTRPGESWSTLAQEILTAAVAENFDVMPSPPFQGALEEMGPRTAISYDHLLVTGWIAHREQRITALTAFLDTSAPRPLLHGLSRPDVGSLFPGLVDGARSRFAGYLRIPPAAPRPLALRIFADLADGRRELVFLKRFRPVLVSGAGTDLPPFSRWKFARASWALKQAGWPASDARRTLREAWTAWRHAAPVADALPPTTTEPAATASRPLRVTLVSHNLNFEGAPLFLLEYARYLATLPGWQVRVVSPSEGPLRAAFAALGVAVTLADPSESSDASPEWQQADVIVANTLVATWAVHLAHRIGKPAILYVHESVNARRFFALQLDRPAIERVEQAFALASRVVFIADAARRVHAALERSANFRVIPGWIDIARIDAYAAAHDRAALRRELGLTDDAVVFAAIGSLMPRKGQHVFLSTVARLRSLAPAGAPLVFLLVGGQAPIDPYADLLRAQAAGLPGADIRFIGHSADPYRFFLTADVFVCASLEEALPRVVMEAAAFGRLIVTTHVNGIPELLGPEDAWFAPPDDAGRLADAMLAALAAQQRGDFSRGQRARAAVAPHFDSAGLLPRHADLIRTVAAVPSS
ncbi:glycosyltransferase [Oleiharenicola lentus]|uniref:Glycosyltransferase n=1 Tax=Oleiharenicola lentus TaxID=2508720 RepID=A0A4Q1C8Z4_9BACT|nr:glycosyltransferase family 4 protein [Oleiharenicola lentus]RXK55445.1 glycosyltransferase [Oleiharenicola lentus]